MNPFKAIDAIHHGNGEIVTTDITLQVSNRVIWSSSVKRKDSSRPPSINAFHMHREHGRSLNRDDAVRGFQPVLRSSIKRLVGQAVLDAYIRASYIRKQYFSYFITAELDAYYPYGWCVTLWWDRDEKKFDWAEIADVKSPSTRVTAGRRIDHMLLQPMP